VRQLREVQGDRHRLREGELGMSFFKDKTILVTGAGGSIGSVLCDRLSHLCETLVALDNSELALYNLRKQLGDLLVPVLADVSDHNDVARLFHKYEFDYIFHAAAYKHVTICEENPGPAWRVNVGGTINLLTQTFGSKARVILVSTDKAVRPTCVMGKTKQAAEYHTTRSGQTVVRLGNVWGSSGSVVPLWKEQIAKGEPVTITHPDATRWFITPGQAADRILLAAERAVGGETFVPWMGVPENIGDVARKLGAREFKYIGLQPGEKMMEELYVGRCETTDHPHLYKDVA
jgi:UDP-N-acetylglucosamine 4,6-dehydratase